MVLKRLVLLMLFTVMVSAPALSFAANCCCLKTAQEKTMTSTDMPPCHEMMADQNQDQQATTSICLCDAGLTTLANLQQTSVSETPAFLKMTYDHERHNPYVSHTISPDNPPPIS